MGAGEDKKGLVFSASSALTLRSLRSVNPRWLTFYNRGSLQTVLISQRISESFMSVVKSLPPPTIESASFLTLHYRMTGPDGADIINTFGGKPATLSLGTGELSPALEQCLLGLPEGTRSSFELAAGLAFGERNPTLVQWVARRLLNELGEPDEPYQVGDVVQFPTPDGMGQYAGSVSQVKGTDGAVQFDFNHPLAGRPVVFEVHVIGVL